MTRRHAPEEFEELPPLLAFAERAEKAAAANRAEVGMTRAAARADRIEPDWQAAALDAVRMYALEHETFLAESVPHAMPEGSDPRAFGAVMRAASRMGYVRADGWAPANSSNRSAKVRWRSLIHVASTSPAASPKE